MCIIAAACTAHREEKNYMITEEIKKLKKIYINTVKKEKKIHL